MGGAGLPHQPHCGPVPGPLRLPPDCGPHNHSTPSNLHSTNLKCQPTLGPPLGMKASPPGSAGSAGSGPFPPALHPSPSHSYLHCFFPPQGHCTRCSLCRGCSAQFQGQTPDLPSDLHVPRQPSPDRSPTPGTMPLSLLSLVCLIVSVFLAPKDGKFRKGPGSGLFGTKSPAQGLEHSRCLINVCQMDE